MQSKSFQAISIEQVKDQLINLQSSEFQATLSIVFASVKYDLKALSQLFDTHKIDLIGCSGCSTFEHDEIIDEAITVLLIDIKKEHYQICARAADDKTTYQIAHEIGLYTKSTFDNPSMLIFSGGVSIDAEQIIFGVKDGYNKDLPLYGGLAGDDLRMTATYVFSNNWISDNGLLSLIINNDCIKMEGLAVAGWETIGIINTITKATGNIIYEINNQPALDVFLKYFGFYSNTPIKEIRNVKLETISGQYPLQIIREAGHSILRSLLTVNENDHSLILAGGVKEGDQFQFSISPGFEVIEQTVQEFDFLKKQAPEADALILISCKGRHTALGPLIEDELQGLGSYWSEAPLIGFFSYGEIGKVKNGSCEFHNITATLVTLKEVAHE